MSLVRVQQGEPKTQANAFRVALGFFVVLAELGPDDRVIRNVFFAGRRTAKKTCTLKPQEALGINNYIYKKQLTVTLDV